MQQEIPLTQKVYDFYRDLYLVIEKMPKKDKYSLGTKVERCTLSLLELVVEAGNALGGDKPTLLTKASTKIDVLKLLIRLTHDVKAIDQKKYLKLEEQLQEIGRMIGGWIKSLK